MNKGERSEFYTFLRLISDGKLYAADANLNKIEGLHYPIIKIIKKSKKHKNPLFYEFKDNKVIILNSEDNSEIKQVPQEEFTINADKLLKIIKTSTSSFSIKEIEEFISEIGSPLTKEHSKSKRDITIVIHDINTGYEPEVGFSIKSRLGGKSTLFNANKDATNLVYTIRNFNELDSNQLESIKNLKAKKLGKKLNDYNCTIDFERVFDSCFESNLQMIDSNFPIILSEIIKLYYCSKLHMIKDLTAKVAEINPCKYKSNETFPFYEHKIKNFLTACALGMTSSIPWNGIFDVSGGYIIVKENGDILCYHIYNWNAFQDYLFNRTFIDTPSTGRHLFGSLEENSLKLNFQVRFK